MIKRILIDLDAMLDTRLGVISNLNSEAAKVLVSSQDYWLRENDDWEKLTGGLITTEQFNKAYAERGGENTSNTINASVLTGIVPFVLQLLAEDNLNRASGMGDPNDVVMLSINTWPYELTGEYKEELKQICNEVYGESVPVETCWLPMEKASPLALDKLFVLYLTYDFISWTKYHHEELSRVMMNCFNFVGPKIYEQDVSKLSADEKKFELQRYHLFKLLHMDFEWIDSRYFSMFRP